MNRWILLVLALGLGGCVTTPPETLPPPPAHPELEVDNPTCVSCGWILEEPSLGKHLSQAKAGDATAAFRISLHYLSLENQQQREYWLLRAAELGHPIALYNLWFNLRNSPICADRLAALAWLEKAAAQGEPDTKRKLDDFRKEAAICMSATGTSWLRPNNSLKPNPLRGSA